MQRSIFDLGTPLEEVTFCVLDLETTGGDPSVDGITEIGVVKVRGGEQLGTFQTFVNPGAVIPPRITMITGITEAMVRPAPPVDLLLPTLLEFLGSSVLVAHNAKFDLGFLNRALDRTGRGPLSNDRLDTLALARRLLSDEVSSCSLGRLSEHFRFPNQPTHRALADALATTDLLHLLIERASAWGVSGLSDLLSLPSLAGHPQRSKLRLTEHLPHAPGVYRFRDRSGTILYVGKATDLRSRVRSYFSSEKRQKIAQLLRETERIDHTVCADPLEAELLERRLIRHHQPRFNRAGRRRPKPTWVALTAERFPRLTITTKPPTDRPALGPMPRKQAVAVVEALQSVTPIRRCTTRIGRRAGLPLRSACTSAQLGRAACPCAGTVEDGDYLDIVGRVELVLGGPGGPDALTRLEVRMAELAGSDRFEEAAAVRDRARALSEALGRRQRIDRLRRAGRLVVETRRGEVVEVPNAEGDPSDPDWIDEQLCIARFLDREAAGITLLHVAGELSSPVPGLAPFVPRKGERLPTNR